MDTRIVPFGCINSFGVLLNIFFFRNLVRIILQEPSRVIPMTPVTNFTHLYW